ncbi:receptor-type tyrosine-protein phosphatase N2-like [Megalops cyprinoides]|uniref:receptor-type tyrosine-protein phosphatase N2-like n=1 Tax=Megalops cyprinoides TaxID=118141 RepID=UPI0018652CCF|nr:receptor-type tyrosine-protein phosphatase N2-like [Megalops cyprinoides]
MRIMDSRYSLFFVFFTLHFHLIASADRKFGCLFEDELCTSYEICVNDGVFGRCHSIPVTDVYTYEVSPSVLQRLRTLLQKLAHRGLTWEDDITQQAISKELSKLRKVSYRRPESGVVDVSGLSRVSGPSGDGARKLKPEEAELGRSLQKYLQRVGLLPQSSGPRPKGERPLRKNEGLLSGRLTDYYQPKSLGKGKSVPPVFTPASSFEPPYPDAAPAGQSFGPYGAERPPSAVSFPGTRSGSSQLLVAALQRYLARELAAERAGAEQSGKMYGARLRPYLSKAESVSPKDGLQGYSGRVIGEDTKAQRPGSDRLLFKAGSGSPAAKNPLTSVDETFIQTVLKQLGKHNVNVDALSGEELDQLADVIADALQVVDEGAGARAGGQRDMKRVPPPAAQLDQQEAPEDSLLQEQQMEGEEKPNSSDKDAGLVGKLLEYLDKNSFSDAAVPDAPAEEEKGRLTGAVGVENVRSRTSRKDLAVQKKEAAEAESGEGGGERERGIPAAAVAALAAAPLPAAALVLAEPQKKDMRVEEELQLDVQAVSATEREGDYGYIITDADSLSTDQGLHLMEVLAHSMKLQMTDFLELSVVGPAVTFKVRPNPQNISTADVANTAAQRKDRLEKETGLRILETGVTDKSKLNQIPTKYNQAESTKFLILTVISIVCIIGVLVASGVVYCMRHRSHHKLKEKLTRLGTDTGSDATSTYQELCRQRMAVRTSERPEPLHSSRINSVSSQFSDGPIPSPSARSSTSSWCEEPVQSNMDISTGHMILSYMEDHLKNKNRLEKEWEALCAYQAEPNASTIAQRDGNAKKNRSNSVLVYDHSRITLKVENNQGSSDYINASPIMDHDPRNPAYIATQGPLPSTVADFWQMVWENGCVVIVMLTPLTEKGVKQCYHYWPDEGSNLYHIYEVNLVSEHIWCEDFLVRSFYLKNMQTNETRTVTQFHFLTWLNQNVPESSRTLLDFRRKVNKCYRGRSCPIIVHCSDGAGRTGTYILIDMVLNKMAKGAKEIDIAATLEHLRDQRPSMVQTKEQFEFALTAVAEEVNAILKALPQ